MLFIKYALSFDFVRKNLLKQIKLKRLSTILPSERILTQQYCEKNFIVYSSHIQTLEQAEKSHELIVWNSNQHPLGTAPLPEVYANAKNNSLIRNT